MFAFRVALAATLVLTPALPAQEAPADTLPFRSHQWAAQFTGGTSFASLGVLRFTAPSRAWLVAFHFTGGHSHASAYAGDSLVEDGYNSTATATARLGRRFYQGRGKSVVSFQTVGVLGGYTHDCSSSVTPLTVGGLCSNGWTAGAFGEVGAAYLITRRFSIGGAATAAFSYQRSVTKGPTGNADRQWAYQGSIQDLAFAATLYF